MALKLSHEVTEQAKQDDGSRWVGAGPDVRQHVPQQENTKKNHMQRGFMRAH